MDRITHQSPKQQGYGSTSSLRNDSLNHTQKHERKEGGIEPKSKAVRFWRTVRPGGADCLNEPRGLSVKANRTSSSEPRIMYRPRGARGLSATHPRTVLPAHADRPKPRPTKTRKHNGSKTKASKNTKNTRRTARSWTVRQPLANRSHLADKTKIARPQKSTPPIHHRISQTVEAVETRVWGHDKRQTRMLYPKNFVS
jgi:hypothetical protein